MRAPLTLCALAVLAACAGDDPDADLDMTADTVAVTTEPVAAVNAVMRDTLGNDLGTLTLQEEGGAIVIRGTLSSLSPGEHGIHIHTTGACEPTFEAAGGHWNPTGAGHGTQGTNGPHFGDLGNLTVGPDGAATVSLTAPGGNLGVATADSMSLMDADGAAIVIHAGADDQMTDPSGNSGARVACGVVQRS